MENIKDFTLQELGQWLELNGEKKFRARQLFHWLYQKRVDSFDQMTTLSKESRQFLSGRFKLGGFQKASEQLSSDGTRKYTFRLDDGLLVETVLMPSEGHATVCLSTQVGCAMGCAFCKTGTMGLKRNLSAGEIVQQVVEAYRGVEEGSFIRNLVFMGMGEPLHNYNNLVKALQILSDDLGFGFSSRRMTVSTAGLVPQLERFIREEVGASLAISLHGPTDEIRGPLMPVNRKWNVERLLEACRLMPRDSRSRITFEYLLIQGVNDSLAAAKKLVKALHGLKCKVNLIPYNTVEESPFKAPTEEEVRAFQQALLQRGVITTVRQSRGRDISAACGQLAARQMAQPAEPLAVAQAG